MSTPTIHDPGTTWAGSHRYVARGILRPQSVEELCELVATHDRVRALGSRHSFTDIADTEGYLVEVGSLPGAVVVEDDGRTAWVPAGATYDQVAHALHASGRALSGMASLPHITVAGAVATGTHGSGDSVGSLASSVSGIELVGADGSLRTVRRGEPDFDGYVVSLGALGIVTRLALDVEPAFTVRQDVLLGLTWEAFAGDIDQILGSAYSVSVFTDWRDPDHNQVWLKSRVIDGSGAVPSLAAMVAATSPSHMLRGGEVASLTAQLGEAGPWHERLPHFRSGFTPSRGAELQSEYFVPREHVADAVTAMEDLGRRLGDRLGSVLQVCEVRSIAADDLWLSGAHGRDTAALHWTWLLDQPAVDAVLPEIEAALEPFGARPHWGKVFTLDPSSLAGLYPRFADFAALRDRLDPDRTFGNAFLTRVLGS